MADDLSVQVNDLQAFIVEYKERVRTSILLLAEELIWSRPRTNELLRHLKLDPMVEKQLFQVTFEATFTTECLAENVEQARAKVLNDYSDHISPWDATNLTVID
jgi:methylphosphotriester-DNA--protein-cysteine methyltransferase